MRAAVLREYGDVDELDVCEVPDPTVGPREVMVRMAGASINPVDWKLRRGDLRALMPLEFPAILGRDASGVVVAVGAEVTAFAPGARVLGLARRAWAELVVAADDAWAEVPAAMNLVDAAALPLVLLTGAQLIDDAVRPREDDVVLVTGATGSVGRAAVFTARARGARVWAGVRARHRDAAARLGAEGVVALDDPADVARLPPLDGIADTVGGDTVTRLLDRLKPDGAVGSAVGEPSGAMERGITARAMWTHVDARRLSALVLAVSEARLAIPIAEKFRLAQVREAFTLAERGVRGKVILLG